MSFDRTRRLYRLFEMDDGSREWWTVAVDNTPGDRLNDQMVAALEAWLDQQPWRDAFYAAFETHRKATIYEDVAA